MVREGEGDGSDEGEGGRTVAVGKARLLKDTRVDHAAAEHLVWVCVRVRVRVRVS